MILADKIIELRKKNGWSQEELAEKLNVSRQSVSKWEGAQSIPDMNRILKMSELFGVSTDFLLKDDIEPGRPESAPEVDRDLQAVSMEEAQEFLKFKQKSAKSISLGVMLCILSPVCVMILAVMSENGLAGITEQAAAAIGVAALFLLIGAAVALFVVTGLAGKRFEYLEKELIDTEYGVDGLVRDRKEKFRHNRAVMLSFGIVLCILSVIPVAVIGVMSNEDEVLTTAGTAILLVMVSVGVLLIVRSSILWGAFQMLLQEGEYTREEKEENRKNENISSIYWCAATAGYLAWSFITGDWHRTWIVWPIAGVAYGVLTAVLRSARSGS